MIKSLRRMTVIAPHPDDEVLGAGATIARFADEGIEVSVIVKVTGLTQEQLKENGIL
jgi:LmbE family N-acetylglucosaminyl deacetylase